MTINRRPENLEKIFPFACLLCAVPVFVSHYPPMVDLPQHAAQVEAIKGVITGDWEYSDLFEITYLTPYWLGYAIVILLSIPFDVVLASKLVVAIALCAYPLSAQAFCKRMGVDPWLSWLLIPLPFGFAYDWGFLNFLVAAPFAYLFLNSAISTADENQRMRWVKVALWIHFLFFAHILIAAFFSAIAVILLSRPWNGIAGWIKRIAPLFTIAPVLTAYVIITFINANLVSAPTYWDINLNRVPELLRGFVSAPTQSTGLIISAFAVSAPFLLGYRPHKNPLCYIPFFIYILWMLFGPHFIFGNSYTYHRFGFFGLPLYLVCFDYRIRSIALNNSAQKLLHAGFISIAISMLAWQSIRSISFEREYNDYRELISYASPGKRMLTFTIDRDSQISSAPLYLHFPLWYQAQTRGLVDFSFASLFVIIQYKDKLNYPIQPGFEWNPTRFDWDKNKGYVYDYFIFKSYINPSQWMMQRSGCRVLLVKQIGDWWLFERVHPDATSECLPDPSTGPRDRPSQ